MRIWILCDDNKIQAYAMKAVNELAGYPEIRVANCLSARHEARKLKHFAYYALNIVAMKGSFNSKQSVFKIDKAIVDVVDFEARQEGAWQHLPASLVDQINTSGADVVLKFGLGLMRVPPELKCPILSYHHGNPADFRGRPAGFWEMMTGAPVMGQIVQVLSDALDAGKVVAYRETPVIAHSLRRTLQAAYAASPSMMNEAIGNARADTPLDIQPTGKNYRLPTNGAVISFLLKCSRNFIARIVYGAFYEKRWQVSVAPCTAEDLGRVACGEAFPAPADWSALETPDGFSFLADPFFSTADDAIYLEGMSRRSGLGDILRIDASGVAVVGSGGGHSSYPLTVQEGDGHYIVPETISWRDLTIFRDIDGGLQPVAKVSVEGTRRVSDPTLFWIDGHAYLMGNPVEDRGALHLWHAESIFSEFRRHAASPVCRGPRGARMGGRILETSGQVFRFGQDSSRDYGNGLFCFRVTACTPSTYEEERVGHIRFDAVKGPHTLDWKDGRLLFDSYRDRFSILAGWRRLKYLLLRRARSGAPSCSGETA